METIVVLRKKKKKHVGEGWGVSKADAVTRDWRRPCTGDTQQGLWPGTVRVEQRMWPEAGGQGRWGY